MGGGSWRYILGGLGLVEVYFKWLEVCRHLLWVGGGRWSMFWVVWGGWTFLWVGGGRWRYILGGWVRVDICLGG